MNDITKTGSLNGAELRLYLQQILSGHIKLDLEKLNQARAQYSPVQTASSPESYLTTYYNSGLSDFGQSIYDAEEFTLGDVENLNLGDIRAENQPWYAKLGAGVAKGLGNAATSFLSGTVGIVYGAGSAAAGGSFWDNDFNKAMDDVNLAMEEWLPNYYTRDEILNPLAWRNIFSANTLGDKLIKNLGFSVGMLYGGGVVSGILKATRLPRLLTKLTGSAKVGRAFTSLAASTTAAAGEANIEAYRGAAEQVKAQTAMTEMEYDDAVRALMDVYTPAIQAGDLQAIAELNTRISELEALKNAKIQLIKDNGRKAGDTIWLGNMAVLMPSNLIQFGKVFTRGLSGMRGNLSLAGGLGNYKSATGKALLLWGIGKGAVTEGMEEVSQGSITRGTANYYEKQLDPDAQEQTKGIMSEITDALTESFVTDLGKEEFLLGAVTGALGIPMVGKRSNGKLGLKVQGGIFNEISDWRHQRAAETFIADQLNARANDPAFQDYYNGLVRHVAYLKDMHLASLANNEDAYKDYEHSQLISDVIMFDSVGRLGDLESMVKFLSENLSDEELDNIVKATSRIDEESGEIIDGEFVDSFGDTVTPMTATEAGKDAMRRIIKNNADGVLNAINLYRKVATKIDGDTDSSLSDNQLKELTFMAMKIQNYNSKQRDNFKAIKDIILNEPELAAEGTALHELLKKANVDLLNNRIPINDRVAELKRVVDNNPELLEKLHTMNLEEINPSWIDTILTMLKNKEAYEAKYKEYKENPERQILDHQKQEKEATKKKAKKERKEAQDKAKESTVGDLANDDSLLDELDQTFNPEDADVTSTTDIFSDLTTEEKETKEKTKLAKIVKGLATEASQLLDKAIDKGLSPLVSSIVSKMLNNASTRVQKDASEFLDRTAVSYLDDNAIVEVLNLDPDFQQASDERKDLIFAETKVEVGLALDTIVEVLNKAYNKRMNTPELGTKEVSEKDDPTDDHPSKLPQETPNVDITSNTKKVGNSILPADAELMHLSSNYVLDGLDRVTGSINDEQVDSVIGVKYINTSNNKALVKVRLKDGTTSDVFYNVKHQNNNATVAPTELPSYENTHPSETENSYFADQLKPSTPRLPIKSPFGDMTPWATILYRIKQAIELKQAGKEIAEEYSKYYEFYKDEIEDPNSMLNKHRMLTESYIKRAAAIHEYLTKVGAFDAVDSNQVLKGDVITLVVDKELTERVGHPIVLLAKISDSGEVTIVGDLLKNRSNAALVSRVEIEYQKYISENPGSGRYISNYHTKVTNNFVGRIPFSKREETSSLNSVFGRNGHRRTFVLGIVKDNSGYILAEGTDIKTSEIRKMKSSKPGQPVILLETSDTKSNRHYVPVPFIMPTYSAENAETTFLGKQVARVVDNIVSLSAETIVSENKIIGIKNELCKTLALDTKDSSVFITFDAANINIDLKINGNRTYIKVPKGENAKLELLTKMLEANIPFIINIKSINDKTEDGDDYNSIIGEIAEVNLHPMRNNHTLSDFFTMEKIPLESEKKTVPAEQGSSSNTIDFVSKGGNTMPVNTDNWEITIDNDRVINDPNHTDEITNIYRAMAYGRKNNLPLDAPYDTMWGRFDPTKNSFVPQKKGQNIVDGRWKKFQEAVSTKDPIKILNEISTIIQSKNAIDKRNEGKPELEQRALYSDELMAELNSIYRELLDQGYKILTFPGDSYDSGMKVMAEFESDDSMPVGKYIIKHAKKPTITHNGSMVLAGEITVLQSPYTSILDRYILTGKLQPVDCVVSDHSSSSVDVVSDTSTLLWVEVDGTYYRIHCSAPIVENKQLLLEIKLEIQEQLTEIVTRHKSGGFQARTISQEAGKVIEEVLKLYSEKLSSTTNEDILSLEEQVVNKGKKEESTASTTINKEQEDSLKKKLARTPNLTKVYDSLEDKHKAQVLNLGSKAKGVLQQLQNYFDPVNNSFTDPQQVKELLYPTKYRLTLTVEKPSKESLIRREVRWFKRILPNLSLKECLVIVENMLDIKNSNLKAWGKFTEGTILVFKNAAKGTVYHEAFHAVTNILLSKEEKDRMFNEAAKLYPELAGDEVALEEALAEDFRRYTLKQQIPFIGPVVKVFRKLNITSRRLRNKSMYLDSMYFRINNGDYGKRNIVSAALGVTRDNAVQEYKDLIRELKYAEKEKKAISDKWEQVTLQIKNPKSALGKLSRTRYKSFSEAASNIPNNLVDVLGVYEDHGRYVIDAKNNLDLKDTLNQILNIIDDTRRALYISENLLESRISDEALDEQEAKYRVANITNIPQENVNNELLEDVTNFFKHFNISLQEVDLYSEQEPLFDALNRVIYYKSNKDITESVGLAMAFMMLHDPMVNKIFWLKSPIYKSLFKFAGLFKNKNKYRAFLYRKLPSKNLVLKGLGHNIAKELQNIYGGKGFVDTNESTVTIILNFFKNWSINSKRSYDLITKYSRNAANSLKIGDYTVIDSTTKKPGTKEETSRVYIDLALLQNPYEEDIIYKLGQRGYALAGSAALAIQGTVFRPSENPLHDIDFQALGKTKDDILEVVNFISPYNKFIRKINNDTGPTYTYLVLDRPFIVERPVKGTAAYVLLDPITRELYGSYTGSELILNGNTKGKFLDFFTGEKRYEHVHTVINDKEYLIGNENYAMEAKIDWQRNKDIWDYNRYLPNELAQELEAEQSLQDLELQKRIEQSNIIWGHPAIGKTTYLETHDDIIEWDKEVNHKRNKFIQELIDPNNELDEKTFNEKRLEYMANPAKHPEYELFLSIEWKKLKAKAKRQNKKIFASPLPLLRMFPQDFDLVINLNHKEFLRNNINRGGKVFSTLDWKYAINNVVANLPKEKVFNTGKYLSELALGITMSPIEQYHNSKSEYDNLSQSDKEYLMKKGISKEEFNSWPAREREIALHCKL